MGLQRQVPREHLDSRIRHLRFEFCARLTETRGSHRSGRGNCLPEFAEVRGVFDDRVGISVSLQDDALRLIVVEVHLVLQGSRVLRSRDLQGAGSQALEFLELACVKLEAGDSLKLTHNFSVRSYAPVGIQGIHSRGVTQL
jgi:hypothetical protein